LRIDRLGTNNEDGLQKGILKLRKRRTLIRGAAKYNVKDGALGLWNRTIQRRESVLDLDGQTADNGCEEQRKESESSQAPGPGLSSEHNNPESGV